MSSGWLKICSSAIPVRWWSIYLLIYSFRLFITLETSLIYNDLSLDTSCRWNEERISLPCNHCLFEAFRLVFWVNLKIDHFTINEKREPRGLQCAYPENERISTFHRCFFFTCFFRKWMRFQTHNNLHPGNRTWISKIAMFKGSYRFQTIILGIHVSFGGCISLFGCLEGGISSDGEACRNKNHQTIYAADFFCIRKSGKKINSDFAKDTAIPIGSM